jgi:hypothetical protein
MYLQEIAKIFCWFSDLTLLGLYIWSYQAKSASIGSKNVFEKIKFPKFCF